MNRRVVITGLGVVSSIGIGRQAFWRSLLEGKSGISPVSSFDTANHFTHNGGEAKLFRPEEFFEPRRLKTMSRANQLGIAAAKLAIADSRMSSDESTGLRIGTCMGITSGAIQVIEDIDDKLVKGEKIEKELACQLPVHSTPASIAKELNLSGPNCIFSTACAAGNYAIGYGYDLIRLGRADAMLAGGSDPFSRISFTGFNQFSAVAPEKCQPFDRNRKGMMVAEGSAILLLELLESARARNADIYA